LIFDQGVGDLFVVRVAGNVVTGAGPIVKGSIEYAVAELGCRLIMVIGHTACGAVKAAIAHIDANDALPESIGGLVDAIKPAVMACGGTVRRQAREHHQGECEKVRRNDPGP
jgi:carbonic anhydrase